MNIMFLGDSLTDWSGAWGYPAYVRDYLKNGFTTVGSQVHTQTPNEPKVYSEGHSGLRTDEIIDGLDGWLGHARYLLNPPTHALLMAGTNNVIQGYATSATLANLVTLQNELISRFRCKVYVGQILPVGTINSALTPAINSLNSAISASTSIERYVYTDVGFNVGTMLIADGFHTNVTGAGVVAQNWANVIT